VQEGKREQGNYMACGRIMQLSLASHIEYTPVAKKFQPQPD
jgi:hypothetical protein